MNSQLTFRVFFPFALGYFLTSIFRSLHTVVGPDVVGDLGFTATEMGFTVSAFYLSGVLLQIPYGVLLDRYDPRKVYAISLVLCAVGAGLTAISSGVFTFTLGRALIAIGTTASAVTSYKVYSMWFSAQRLPLANGMSIASGSLGLMAGTAPIELALQWIDWRGIHLVVGLLVAFCAVVVMLVVPTKSRAPSEVSLVAQIKGLSAIISSPLFWRTAPLMTAVIGIFGAVLQVWTGAWMRDVAQFARPQAADVLFVMMVGVAVGGLASGVLADIAQRFGLTLMAYVLITAVLFTGTLLLLGFQWVPSAEIVGATWALFGFLAMQSMVTYAALGPQFAPTLTGRLNGCLTLSWMLGAFVLQNVYGFVLDLYPSSSGAYSVIGHQVATFILLGCLIFAIVWYFVFPTLQRNFEKKHEVLPL